MDPVPHWPPLTFTCYVWYLSPARFRVLMQQQLVYEREVEAARLISTVSHLSKVLPVFRIMSDSGNTSVFYLYWALLWPLLQAQLWQPIGRMGCYLSSWLCITQRNLRHYCTFWHAVLDVSRQGWYIVTYALGIYHLNLFIAFLSPKVDPSLLDEGTLAERITCTYMSLWAIMRFYDSSAWM